MSTTPTTLDTYADNMLPDLLADPQDNRATALVNEDGTIVDVYWLEPLAWHLEYNPGAAEALIDQGDPEAPTVRQGVQDAWLKVLAEHLPEGLDLEDGDEYVSPDDETLYLTASARFTFPEGESMETVYAALHDKFLAPMVNGTDPGTFNHPYFVGRLV